MKKFKVFFALVFVVLAGAIGAYIALTDETPNLDSISSFMAPSGPSDSDAIKAGKLLDQAVREGDVKLAMEANVDLNTGLAACYKADPSSAKCAALQKVGADRFGSALIAAGKKFLSDDKVAAMERPAPPAPTPAPQFSSTPIAPPTPENVPVRRISPELYQQLEREIAAGGGTIIADPVPAPVQELRPMEPLMPSVSISETPRSNKATNQFVGDTCSVSATGTKLIKLRKDLEKLEKTGKLTAIERCELRIIRQGWRERKALMAQK